MFPKEVIAQLQNEDKLPSDTQHSSNLVLGPEGHPAVPERRNLQSCGNMISIKNHWSIIKRGPNKGVRDRHESCGRGVTSVLCVFGRHTTIQLR